MPLPLVERVLILEQERMVLRGQVSSLLDKVEKVEGMLTEFNSQRERLKERMQRARKGRKRA